MNTIKSILRLLLLIATIAIVYFVLVGFWEDKVPRILSIVLCILSLLIFVAGKRIKHPKLLAFFYLTLFFALLLSVFVSVWEKANAPFGWIFYIVYGVIVIYLSTKVFGRSRRKQFMKMEDKENRESMETPAKEKIQLKTEKREKIGKEDERKERNAQLQTDRKRKTEEQKLIQGLSVIKIMGTVEIYDKKGKKCGSQPLYEEMIVNASQRRAFVRGDLQTWVSNKFPGGKAKNIHVTGQRPCTIEDYYRLKGI